MLQINISKSIHSINLIISEDSYCYFVNLKMLNSRACALCCILGSSYYLIYTIMKITINENGMLL
jgi:hypothetical protein